MADPVTIGIMAAGSMAATGAGAASQHVQLEGAKGAAEDKAKLEKDRIDAQSFQATSQALAQEGTTQGHISRAVDLAFSEEASAKGLAQHEEDVAKHEADVAIEQGWVQAAGEMASTGMMAGKSMSQASKVPPPPKDNTLLDASHHVGTYT